MRFVSFLLRLFAFIQWLAAMAIGAVCIALQADTLEQAGEIGSNTSPEPELGGLDILAVSASITLPGLLASILLILSAIYCAQAGNRSRPPELPQSHA